jgi:hypothetical protein
MDEAASDAERARCARRELQERRPSTSAASLLVVALADFNPLLRREEKTKVRFYAAGGCLLETHPESAPENCPFQFRQANCGIEGEQKNLTKGQKNL